MENALKIGRIFGLLLMSVFALAMSCNAKDNEATPTATTDTAKAPMTAQMAVYRWGAPKGPAQVDAFAQWIRQPDVWAEDFEASDNWDNVANPGWQLWPWHQWVSAKAGRRLILTVPMLVGAWDGKGPSRGMGAGKPVSLVEGATGAYNEYYKTLATKLVEQGLGDSIIRLGHEFNGGWYTWRASVNPKAFAEYWRQIVTTMRSVPGTEKLEFCWNPAMGWQQFPADQAWPEVDKDGKYVGNYVDYVGLDLYDDSWLANTYPWPEGTSEADIAARQAVVWDKVLLNGQFGLNFWKKFAIDHKKQFAIPEWGVSIRDDKHGGFDNPLFIENMYKFINDPENHVAFHVYFDVWAGDGNHQLSPGQAWDTPTKFPKSAAKFRELFGGPVVPTKLPLQINVGGKDAAPFIADKGYSGGDFWETKDTIKVTAEHAAPMAVYQSTRQGKLSYVVPDLKADASYTVRLHFSENYFGINNRGGKGSRLFNVTINGTPVLTDFDVFDAAGGAKTAVVKEFTAKADKEGILRIDFTPSATTNDKNPIINGIEILQ